MKPARLRPQAEQDLTDAARYYSQAGSVALGAKMFDAAIAALKSLERMLGIGSPRIGQLCEVPGLRALRISGFPLQWFYFEVGDHLDIVRLLGDRQDIVAILGDEA